jgi:hypothetical protein
MTFNKIFHGVGVSVCSAYLVLFYILPFSIGALFDYSYLVGYKGDPEYLYTLPAVIIYFSLFILVYKGLPKVITPLSRVRTKTFSRPYLNLFIVFFFLVLSLKFYQQYGLAYRQTGNALSESDSYVMLLLILKIYFSMFLLLKIADISYGIKVSKVDTITLILGTISFCFATTASLDTLRILISILILVHIFSNKNYLMKLSNKYFLMNSLRKIFIFLVGFMAIIFIGLTNKKGFSGAYELITSGTLIDFLKIPLARLSVHFYTLSYHLNYTIFDFNFQMQSLPNVIENFFFRVSHLTGGDFEKPAIMSSSRLNSLSIIFDPSDRNGSSPGLIGSIFFIPFFPFSIVLSLLYVSFLLKKVESIFSKDSKCSLITTLYILVLLQVFTDAQIDILNFLGVAGVQLVLLYLVWFDRPEFRISR